MTDPAGPDSMREAIRQRMRAELASVSHADLRERSQRACRRFIDQNLLDDARTVMIFAPLIRHDGSREIDVSDIAHEAWKRGLTVCAPAVDWADSRLTPLAITNLTTELVPTRHGVQEPRQDLPHVDPAALDLVLVPGLAFDRTGNRLGHGVGFYDRFLALPQVRALRIGMALSCQIVESLPHAPHDVPMQIIVTEDEVLFLGSDHNPSM